MTVSFEESIERERQRVRQQLDALRQLETEQFASGGRVLLGSEPLPVLISAGLDPTRPERHFVSIGGSGQPLPIAQDLACGVLADGKRLVATRRTDGLGQFVVDLAEGRYSLRPVVEVRTAVDVDILEQLGDDVAGSQLDAALFSGRLSGELREKTTSALGRLWPKVPPRPLDVPRVPENHAAAARDHDSAAEEAATAPATAKHGWWVDQRGAKRLVFRYPAGQAEIPFSAVWLIVREGNQEVVSRLLPVQLDEASSCYANSIALRELLGERPYSSSLQMEFWAAADHLLQKVPLDEAERVLATPYVEDRPDVRRGVARLKRRLSEALESSETPDQK